MIRISRQAIVFTLLLVTALILGLIDLAVSPHINSLAGDVAAGDWPSYMYDGARSGYNARETQLSPANAQGLKLVWKRHLGNVLAAQPIVKGDTVYAGSWDGNLYALNKSTGAVAWKANLGQTTSKRCSPETAGITSAAAVDDKAVYVGGGDNYLYALDPRSGSTLWKFRTGDNSPEGGAYNWASPLLYNDRVYYGNSSFCDQPFTHAEMWGVNRDTGKAEQTTSFMPADVRGGGIWTSPTVDQATGNFYVTIGSGDYYIPHNYSMARLDPTSLKVIDSWQIPIDEQVFDGDWGTTPTLFRDQSGLTMVGAAAKNGYYYAFRADHISAGPAWRVRISDGGQCPQCGEGAISSSVYAYNTVYVAAGYFSLGQVQKFPGTVHALDPTTGATRWIHPTSGPVVPAMAAANGLIAVAANDTIELLNAATGELVWEYATGGQIYAAPSIASGMIFAASTDGNVYAFSAGPYNDSGTAYNVPTVGSNPPGFTVGRTPVAAAKLPGQEECFSDTNKCVRGDFLSFFKERGGLERFGPPVTEELNEAGRTVQYFRNAALQIQEKPEGKQVEYAPLDFRLSYVGTNTSFDQAQPIEGATYVPETHHNLKEPFLTFWKTHGDIANLGYPVSEVFDEVNAVDHQTRQVQYFDRSRLEIVKNAEGNESVKLGAFGIERYLRRYNKLP